MREAAHGLAGRGYAVEVLTTCAHDHFTWANESTAGRDDGRVRDHSAVPDRAEQGSCPLEQAAGRLLSGDQLDDSDELAWSNGRFRVPDLYPVPLRPCDAVRRDRVLALPFWTTLYCAGIAPERTVLMPCLHDEPYAYLRSVAAASASAEVVWFLSEPEHQLAHRLAPVASHHAVIGAAVDIPESYDPEGFCERHDLVRPYVLYAGRREGGKGWQELMAGFALAIRRHQPALRPRDRGCRSCPSSGRRSRADRGSGLSRARRGADAFAAAAAFVQPSANESFSRTIMEAWLAETVVIASGASDVVTWHCDGPEEVSSTPTSSSSASACGSLRKRRTRPRLARMGRDYVLANYRWPTVLDAMERSSRSSCDLGRAPGTRDA